MREGVKLYFVTKSHDEIVYLCESCSGDTNSIDVSKVDTIVTIKMQGHISDATKP